VLITRSGFLSREELRVLFLNSKNKLIEDDVVSKGTINEISLYIREIVALALKRTAVSIIVSHNHPSGDVMPSKNDIKTTYNLKQALDSVSIVLQDHIITSGNNYFSFKQEGLL
jgi:DNA repair protein RadC